MSADFKPTLDGYKDLKPFVFWAQTTMPTVFDDSLSYYEVLTKLTKMVNVLLENTDTAEHNIEALAGVFEQLQDYVNHYFDSLDVSDEVNARLDEMVADGTLDELIQPIVVHYTSEVIDDVVHEQLSAVVSEQIGGAVANQIDAAIAPQITPKVNAYLDTNLPPMVEEQVPVAVGEQIDPAVAVLLPSVVDEQLPNAVSVEMATALPPVVTNQLPGVVATQIPGAVASQMPAILPPIATQQIQTLVPNWLATHIHNPSSPPLDDTLGLKNCAAESWYVGRRFFDLQGSPTTMEEDKKVVYQTGEVVEAEHWLTFTATVSDKFPVSVGYPHFDLEQDPIVDWTYAYYDADGNYISESGNTWEGFINWGSVTDPVPDGAAMIKFSIQSDVSDFVSGDLAVLVFGNGAQIIDAINEAVENINLDVIIDDTLTQAGKAADAKITGDEINELKKITAYELDTVLEEKIPFGIWDSASGGGISAVQNGETVTLNGTSSASSSQGYTKILICDHVHCWNGTNNPQAENVFNIPTVSGRVYKISADVLSGTRNGNIRITYQLQNSSSRYRNINPDATHGEIEFTSGGENVQLLLGVASGKTVTNLVVRVSLRDVTAETLGHYAPLMQSIRTGTTESKIINASGKISTSTSKTSVEIVNQGWSAVTVEAGPNVTHISFLAASIHGLSSGDAVTLASGEPARHDIPAGTKGTLLIPADCTHINIMQTYSGTDFLPKSGFFYASDSPAVLLPKLAADAIRPSHSLDTVTACIIGASVEAGQTHETPGDSSTADPTKAYLTVALQNNGVTVTNLSHGGMGYLRPASDSTVFKDLIDNTDFTAFDSVYLTLGSNDWNYDYALGTPTDTETSTVCGMLRYALNVIYTSNPVIKVFVKTPGMRATKGDVSTLWGWNAPNAAATPYTLKDVHDAITEICEDAMVECMNDPASGIINAYNMLSVYPDGSHPNKATMALMAKNMTGRIALK